MTQSSELERTVEIRLYQPGQSIDGYQIVEVLGHGGMGAVYRVTRENREYALKVMLKENLDVHDLAHFEREAQATAAIRHPNVVAVHSLQLNSATPYILFDYVRGQSLDCFIDQSWTLEQLIPFLRPIAEALDHIHEQGLIHRDLKPANIIAREHDRCPLLADFGLARGGSLESLTQTGMVKGTPSYMAPEQLQGLKVGPGVDLWAFAVMTYQLLSGGTLPFIGENPIALASAVMLKEAPPISKLQKGLSEALDTVFEKAFAKETDDRYESVTAFLDDCERARIGEPILGQAPASYKGAIRNFHAGGARAAFKLLLIVTGILIVVSGISFGIWSQWQSSETERQLAELKKSLNPRKIEKRFRVDFYREFERRLIEKVTGIKTDIVRPDYLIEDEKLAELATTIENLAIEESLREKLLRKQKELVKLTKIWTLLERLSIAEFKQDGDSLEVEVKDLGESYQHLLKAGVFIYCDEWQEAYDCLESSNEESPERTVRLGHGLIAWKLRDYKRCQRELSIYLVDQKNQGLQELCDSARRKLFVSKLFQSTLQLRLKELNLEFPRDERVLQNPEWALIKLEIQKKWKRLEQSDEKDLVEKYNAYFENRPFVPELDPWPLKPALLRALIAAEPKKERLGRKALLYALLLHELEPEAKLPSGFPVDTWGRVSRSAIEPFIHRGDGNSEADLKLLILFSRYGLFLESGTAERLSSFKEKGTLYKHTDANEIDPILMFWRGLSEEEETLSTELRDLKKKLRSPSSPSIVKEARSLWEKLEKSESDLLYSLKSGQLGAQHYAIGVERLCRLWRHKIELGISEQPERLRKRGITMLEAVIDDHPDPPTALGFLVEFARFGRQRVALREKIFEWTEARLRYLRVWKQRSKKGGGGIPFRKEGVVYDPIAFKKKMNLCHYTIAIFNAELGEIERGFSFLKKAVKAHYHHGHMLHYFIVIKARQNPDEHRRFTELIELGQEHLKNKGNDDFGRSKNLLKEVSVSIEKIKELNNRD